MMFALLSIALISLFILIPVYQVYHTRRGPITNTPLMRRRVREARSEGRNDFKIDFHWLEPDELNYNFLKAAIAVEDPIFLTHHGFDLSGLRTSLGELIRTKKVTCGHSTITNQIARNVFLTLRKHYWRKLLEFYYSILIECIWGKRRILEVYVNVIEMGDGVFGCEAAALHHFGKHAADLTIHESILIAVAFRNPRRFTPALFSTNTGWWTDVVDMCEWMVQYWDAPTNENLWNLRGRSRRCPAWITVAPNIAKRLSRIAVELKTIYRLGAIGTPTEDGGFAFDSCGLIKSDLWSWNAKFRPNVDATLCTNSLPNVNENEMIEMCRNVSSDFSTIQIGELVWDEGHVGLYVGDGLTVESTPLWKGGVQLAACNCDREGFPRHNWTKHGKFPFIYYTPPTK